MGFDGRRNGGAIGNVVVVERKRQLGGRIAGFLGLRSTCTGDGHRIVVDGAEITARCLPYHLGGFIATCDRNIGGSGRHLVGVASTAVDGLDQPTSFRAATVKE